MDPPLLKLPCPFSFTPYFLGPWYTKVLFHGPYPLYGSMAPHAGGKDLVSLPASKRRSWVQLPANPANTGAVTRLALGAKGGTQYGPVTATRSPVWQRGSCLYSLDLVQVQHLELVYFVQLVPLIWRKVVAFSAGQVLRGHYQVKKGWGLQERSPYNRPRTNC